MATHEHFASQDEPLLGIADVAAWCHGAAGDWARRIEPVLGDVVRLDQPGKREAWPPTVRTGTTLTSPTYGPELLPG
ncbi:MAG: hypothetical protein HOY78_08430 [Saccharothrix sp.]|nr:hypothetical protein [Saccharothrix sp.]